MWNERENNNDEHIHLHNYPDIVVNGRNYPFTARLDLRLFQTTFICHGIEKSTREMNLQQFRTHVTNQILENDHQEVLRP
jgi:hypothetical protein